MKLLNRIWLVFVGGMLLAANAYAGRWITRDPMEVQAHMERDPHPFLELNPYTFNNNNPLSYIDPDGLAPQLVTVTGNLNGGLTGAGYVDYRQGQDYGIGLHGPIDTRPIDFTLNVLGKIQQPIDATERWLKDSGNPFIRAGGGLLAGVQWVLPEGKLSKLGKGGKACRLERYGSKAEAEASELASKLLPRPGHERQPKWVGLEGTIDPRTLGKAENYTHRMDIDTSRDALNWLNQNAILKPNEPGRFGIPADKLEEFNQMIQQINSSTR